MTDAPSATITTTTNTTTSDEKADQATTASTNNTAETTTTANAQTTASVSNPSSESNANTTARSEAELTARKYLADRTQQVTIPDYAASWFDMKTIHNIERVSLPEFFTNNNPSKTATIYQDYRDFMILTYRLNPKEYLTVTACRRNLAGDVCAIMRVHAFLEQWGLINYECDPSTWPSAVGPPYTGHFRVTADTPRGLQPFKPNIKPTASQNAAAAAAAAANKPAASLNVELRQKIYDNITGKQTKQYFCTTCGAECSRERYHSLKTKNVDLCPLCYKEGRFPITSFSSDFIKYDSQLFNEAADTDEEGALSAGEWSDEEVLLLLEAIELYDDDWNAIAAYVGGTKTREQCLTYFLQMPIDEPYRDTDEHTPSNATSSANVLFEHKRIPFSQADNPVMSILAFLASAVDPKVASAAADAAIACQEKLNSIHKRKEPHNEGEENEEDRSMDIDSENQAADHKAKKPRTAIEKAAAVALGSAAAKAKSLSTIEEHEMRRLVQTVIDTQVSKLELKMRYFDELEAVLDNELETIAQQRKDVFRSRLAVKKSEALLEEEIQKRGGLEKAIEDGWTVQQLQQFVQNIIYKEDYHLVDLFTLDESTLAHPASAMDEGNKQAASVLSL
ncbi:SWIRM domain-containing protein [Mycotypha africana]|uniref:SWIRM domain-containing protein n=1 Tax=Mycotypha africana TaxID=64632 RepID=UPI002300D631|nr:SWIRM domain-containing protein [Mycotypha africana]KAI8973398.1 SWIRM domain-containing protein [Mycotypha africana]